MMLSIILTLLPLALAQTVQVVEVGKGGQKFSPETLTVAKGSQVQFKFVGDGHAVTASTFEKPCVPASDSTFFSGDGDVGNTFTITVNDTNPIWFYCPEAKHCAHGMIGVINAPSSGNTLADLKSAAAQVSESAEPAQPQGGIKGDASTSAASTSSGSSSSATSSAASTSATDATGTKPSSSASASAKSAAGIVHVSSALGVAGVLAGLVAGLLAV